jgi:hypothetical protein
MKRSVPLSIKLGILFGSFTLWFGMFFFLFGSLFMFIFGSGLSFSREMGLWNAKEYAQGYIRKVEPTNSYVNDAQVIKYLYSFRPDSTTGEEFASFGYGTVYYDEGELVTVRYLAENPHISEAVGLDTSSFPIWVLLILSIFPLIGLAFVIPGIVGGLKNIRILTHGQLAWGTYQGATPTNVEINNMPVMKAAFQFTASDRKTYTAHVKTHRIWEITDEPREMLLYMPGNPEKATLVDLLPKRVRRLIEEKKF